MFKYAKGDPIRIFALVVALAVCVIVVKGMIVRHNNDTDGLRTAFCDGFIEATQENLSVSLNKPIELNTEQKQAIRGIFDRSISISNLMDIAKTEEKIEDIQKSDDFINIMTRMMPDADKKIYEDICLSYTKELSVTISENLAEK